MFEGHPNQFLAYFTLSGLPETHVFKTPDGQSVSVADMVKDVDNGLYIHGRGSYSIDQQRYNAQFGAQLVYEIKHGQVTGLVEDAAYQIRTPEFWNACTAICDERDFRLSGMTKFVGLEAEGEELTQPEDVRAGYLAALADHQRRLADVCHRNRIELVDVNTGHPPAESLIDYLDRRSRFRHR